MKYRVMVRTRAVALKRPTLFEYLNEGSGLFNLTIRTMLKHGIVMLTHAVALKLSTVLQS
jgi:hypothetical protein